MKTIIFLLVGLFAFALIAYASTQKPFRIAQKFQVQLAYSGSNLEYVGKSLETCGDGELCWQIAKLAYSGSNLTDVNYANGSHAFDYEWDERASYTYS